MKTLQQLTLLIFVLIQSIGYSQENKLQTIIKKYSPSFEELNTDLVVLNKKNGATEIGSIGNYNLNENSVFNIGSATKKMTSILILQEVEKGNLKLSDSIGSYLSPIKNVDGTLPIESLLRHRSGLGELVGQHFANVFYSKNDSIYNTNLLDKIPPSNPEKVGKHNYCNTNYMLLGRILESVTDMSYFDLLRANIFEPCNMTNTYPYVSKSIKNLAHPTDNGKDVYEQIDYRFFANYAYAAGSIASTLNDMSKFYDHLFSKNTLLNQASIEKLIDFDDANYGLGMQKFEFNDVEYYGHGGTNLGYSFREYYNPKNGDLLLYFITSDRIPFHKLFRDEIINNESIINFNLNIVNDFKLNIGTYFFKEMNTKIEIFEANKKLFLEVQGMKLLLVSYEKDKLLAPQFGIELEINPNINNEITFRQNGMEAVVARVSQKQVTKN